MKMICNVVAQQQQYVATATDVTIFSFTMLNIRLEFNMASNCDYLFATKLYNLQKL